MPYFQKEILLSPKPRGFHMVTGELSTVGIWQNYFTILHFTISSQGGQIHLLFQSPKDSIRLKIQWTNWTYKLEFSLF